MKKKILISCQMGSDPENTIAYGVELAKNINAQVKLVWAVKTPEIVSTGLYPLVVESEVLVNNEYQKKTAKRLIKKLAHKYNPPGQMPVITQAIIDDGDEVKSLSRIAEAEEPDFILCGMEDEPSVRQDLLGTPTTQFAEKSSRPILAVPSNAKVKYPEKILIASPVDKQQLYALRLTAKIFEDSTPKIALLNFSEKEPKALLRNNKMIVKSYQKLTGHSNLELFNVSSRRYTSVIEYLVSLERPDLLVFQPNQISFLPGLSQSSATRLIRQMEIPILLL